MKTWKEIVEMIELQEEVIDDLLSLEEHINTEEIRKNIKDLTSEKDWEKARKNLKTLLNPDEKGFKMLLCMICSAAYSYEKYTEQGIPESVFRATMKCFTRFTGEHKVSFGYYGFDRDFWAGRQLSLLLFRLGELEFEKVVENGKRIVSIHIPSDAILTEEKCKKSIDRSVKFFEKYDCQYANVEYSCNSWLLSPALKELLPQESRILRFQSLFRIESVDKSSDAFLEWVYKRKDIKTEDLPENTSLQKKMKEYLLNGGKVGEAKGYLCQVQNAIHTVIPEEQEKIF